jgi:hypothetical protein
VLDVSLDASAHISELQDVLAQRLPHMLKEGTEFKFIHGGSVLAENLSLVSAGLKSGDVVVVRSRRKQPPALEADPTPIPNSKTIAICTAYPPKVTRTRKPRIHPIPIPVALTEELATPIYGKEQLSPPFGSLPFSSRSESGPSLSAPTARSTEGGQQAEGTEEAAPSNLQLPAVDETSLLHLTDMGFTANRATKALLLNGMNTQFAMEWLLIHNEDEDIDAPISEDHIRHILRSIHTFTPHSESARKLKEMGFSENDVKTALRINSNNSEAALAWLLGDRQHVVVQGTEFEGGMTQRLGEDVEEEADLIDPDPNDLDDPDLDGQDDHSLVSTLLAEAIRSGLPSQRVVQALDQLTTNPETANELLNDREVGPLLHSLLQHTQHHDQ